jgi:hypothetical protein
MFWGSQNNIRTPINLDILVPAVPVSGLFTQSTVISATVVLLSIYLSAVRYLRFRHTEKIQQKYGRTPAEFSKIDYKDAQAILNSLWFLDAPWIFLQAKDFAILRAFSIPTISEVSVKAKKIIHQPGLRYSDTTVFGLEWIMNPLDSERARLSLNRVNFIHSRYQGITSDQMVYVLCLLVSEIFVRRQHCQSPAIVPNIAQPEVD